MNKGKIYLIPTPISTKQKTTDILLPKYINIIKKLKYFVVETPKTARAHLKDLVNVQDVNISELNEHTEDGNLEKLLEPIEEGNNIGVLSDAGLPSIADPGFRLISLAQERGIEVVPFIGPSSIYMALMASGLNGQSFAFWGYLPKEKGLKRKRIKSLERIALNTGQTQIFMETPYKNQYILEEILNVCELNTKLCIAIDIMGKQESITTKKISEWKKKIPSLEKIPCLFLINI